MDSIWRFFTMAKSISKFTPYVLLLFLAGIIFYFDKGLMIGTDNSWYLDEAYMISHKARFLVDYFDYRIPVLPLILSPVYGFGFSDFANRYIELLLVYSLYIFLIYHISFSITRSQYKSLFAVIICFISLFSRSFDAARNICQPLFHHTLELGSIYILWAIFKEESVCNTFNRIVLPAISGILFGLAFIGRQVHVFPALLLLFYISLHIYRNGFKISKYTNLIKVVTSFVFGFVVISSILFWYFYTPGVEFIALAKTWLIDAALKRHPAQESFYSMLLSIARNVRSVTGVAISDLPIIFITSTCIPMLLGYIMFCDIKKGNGTWTGFKEFGVLNKDSLFLLLTVIIAHFFNILPTGGGSARYQGPIFTFYVLALSIILANIELSRKQRNCIFIIVLFVINFYGIKDFCKFEVSSFRTSLRQTGQELFPSQIAKALKRTMKNKGDTVLVLGTQSTCCRLAGYRPFMGYLTDVSLFGTTKVYDKQYIDKVIHKLDNVNVAYKLPDYPNLAHVGEDASNVIYQKIESILAVNFEVVANIPPDNSYPYNYKKGAIIYKRKD